MPFVGPAGAMLDKALEDAGIPRRDVYLTNAVKHFKWEPRGKRRIHKRPRLSEIKACRSWLEAELRAIKPQIVVLLGATAAQSIMGPQFKLMQNRGQICWRRRVRSRPGLPRRPASSRRSIHRRCFVRPTRSDDGQRTNRSWPTSRWWLGHSVPEADGSSGSSLRRYVLGADVDL